MPLLRDIQIVGIPRYVPESIAEEARIRLIEAVQDLLFQSGMKNIQLTVGTEPPPAQDSVPSERSSKSSGRVDQARPPEEMTIQERSQQYQGREPLFDFEFLVVPEEVRESLLAAVELVLLEETVFDRWNLRKIEPFPRAALNFHGPPGTGKTLAAHAVAQYLGKKILPVSYAEVESKYVGDGSKNVEAVFFAAERDDAVLFVDEADSLLSRRLTDVTQGAEQAINSMRSQLLISLEKYSGIVIFSTNLVENYDRAFESRMRHIFFPMPDEQSRLEIWRRHLPDELPLSSDVSVEELARLEVLSGREIKNAVIDAALRTARAGKTAISMEELAGAVRRLRESSLTHTNRIPLRT